MYIWGTPSSTQVFKHTRKWPEDSTALTLHAARNMVVSGQVCLRDPETAFEVTALEVGSLPAGITAATYITDYMIYNDGVPYPDILSTKTACHVAMNATQSLWFSFTVGEDAPVGTHTVTVTVKTSLGGLLHRLEADGLPRHPPRPQGFRLRSRVFPQSLQQFPQGLPLREASLRALLHPHPLRRGLVGADGQFCQDSEGHARQQSEYPRHEPPFRRWFQAGE